MIKPLLLEVKIKEEIMKRLKKDHDLNLKDLKMVNTVLRVPTMTLEFQKALRARKSDKKLAEFHKQAIS